MVIAEHLLKTAKTKKIQQDFLTLLEEKNSDGCIIVVWEEGADEAFEKKGNPLLNKLTAERYAQYFDWLEPAAVSHWIAAEFKKRGGVATSAASALLSVMVGNDLWQASSEIDKLIAFRRNQPITDHDVKTLTQANIDDDIYQLTNALSERNRRAALVLIARQLKSGTAPLELLAKIGWQLKNLLLIKDFMDTNGEGYPSARIGQQLGIHPFVVKKTLPQLTRYSLLDLKKMYRQVLEIDYKIKTSQINPEVLFDLLVVKN